jgi:hypothetical protein
VYVVEVFLPLETGDGRRVGRRELEGLVTRLAEKFGGATAFTRSPALGLWKPGETIEKDQIIIVEVMVEELDEAWWRNYRRHLEKQFDQDEILIRATSCRKL